MTDATVFDSTRSYYERNAETYAAATLAASMGNHVRSFAAALPEGAAVVDLGCGSGRDLIALAQAGLAPVGVDYSVAMAAIASRTSGRPIIVADMRDLPLGTGTVDGIWAAASLLHLPMEDLPRTLSECRRVLRHGGAFYASVKAGTGEGPDIDGRFFAFHSRATWTRALDKAGLSAVRIGVACERRVTGGQRRQVRWLSSLSLAI